MTTISALPDAPNPLTDSQASYNSKALAFTQALPTLVTEINTVAGEVNTAKTAAETAETNAAASAQQAQAAANVTEWVSGTSYTEGDCVWSPTDHQTYRRTVSGGGTTDPSADAGNWVALTSDGNVVGPATATADSLARYDGTTGKLLKDGAVIGVDIQAYSASTPVTAASQAQMEAGTESALLSMSPLRVAQAIAALSGGFPTGTTMLFQQTSAPTGWTKSMAHDNKALRVVTGAASSGGTDPFTTVFGKTVTDSTILTEAQMPSHQHTLYGPTTISAGGSGGVVNDFATGNVIRVTTLAYTASGSLAMTGWSMSLKGSSAGHTHGMDTRVQYVDVIIAVKD